MTIDNSASLMQQPRGIKERKETKAKFKNNLHKI